MPDESTNGILVKQVDMDTGQVIGSQLNLYSQIFDDEKSPRAKPTEENRQIILDFTTETPVQKSEITSVEKPQLNESLKKNQAEQSNSKMVLAKAQNQGEKQKKNYLGKK